MTDNEIIKAVELMSAEDGGGFLIDILDLLKRQKARIKELKAGIKELRAMISAEEDYLYYLPFPFKALYDEEIVKAKSEAITEFAKRLKERSCPIEMNGEINDFHLVFFGSGAIDEVVQYYLKEVNDNGT